MARRDIGGPETKDRTLGSLYLGSLSLGRLLHSTTDLGRTMTSNSFMISRSSQ